MSDIVSVVHQGKVHRLLLDGDATRFEDKSVALNDVIAYINYKRIMKLVEPIKA